MKQLLLYALLFISALVSAQTLQITSLQPSGGPVTGITVTITPSNIPVGGIGQGSAIAVVTGQGNIDVTNAVLWTSSTPSIAFVSNGTGSSNCSAAGIYICPAGQVFGISAGTANITACISNGVGGCLFSQTVTVTVSAAPVISQAGMTNCPPGGTVCTISGVTTGMTFNFSASGGNPPYTWSLIASSCLTGSGLTLSAGGSLSGATPVVGTYSCTVKVTDNLGGNTQLAVSIVITAAACGPPNFCAYSGQQVIGVTTVADYTFGTATNSCHLPTSWNTSCNNGATNKDTSYNTYANVPISNLSSMTRCTDPGSAIDAPDVSFSAGEGGSGAINVCSIDSLICQITNNGGGNRYYTALLKSGGVYTCVRPGGSGATKGIFGTQDQNTSAPGGSNALTVDMGTGQFDYTTAGLRWLLGPGFNIATTVPTQVYPITMVTTAGVTQGNYSYPNGATCGLAAGVPCPTVEFAFGLPIGANAPEFNKGSIYSFGQYVTHTLANLEAGFPEYRLWKPNCGSSNLSNCPMSTAYILGDIIVPGDGSDGGTNPGNCAYKLITVGTTGGTALTAANPCKLDTITDGTAKWKGIAGQAKFIYQATVGGTSAIGGSAFWLNQGTSTPPLHPDMGSTTTFGTSPLVLTSIGPNYTPLIKANVYSTAFGVSNDQHHFAASISLNTYGGLRCTNGDCYSYASATQDTGIFTLHANTSDPVTAKPTYYLLNLLTGIQTNWTCTTNLSGGQPPTLGSCGTITSATWGTQAYNSIVAADGISMNCPDFFHGGFQMRNGTSQQVSTALIVKGTSCPTVHDKEWLPEATFNASSGLQFYNDGINHGVGGVSDMFDFHNCGQGQTSGVYTCAHPQGNASGNQGGLPIGCGALPNSVQCSSCGGSVNSCASQPTYTLAPYGFSNASSCSNGINTTNPVVPAYSNGVTPTVYGLGLTPAGQPWTTQNNGTNAPACNLASTYDNHMGLYLVNPANDNTAYAMGSVYNSGNANPIPNTAWQGEEVAMQLTPAITTSPAVSNGNNFRFAHTGNCNNNALFSGQFTISESLFDGSGILWTSDLCNPTNAIATGSNGPQATSTTGTGVPVQDGSSQLGHLPVTSVPASILAFQGPVWQASFPYVTGNIICAIQGSQGGGKHFNCFQATMGGTSGTAQPTGFGSTTDFSPTAAVTPTAGSSSGTTATLTLPNTCTTAPAGGLQSICIHTNQLVIVSGMTPSGYNCAAPGCLVTANSTTSISYTTTGSNLGAATVFGSAYGAGSTFTDGGVTWQNVGFQNGRTDVILLTTK